MKKAIAIIVLIFFVASITPAFAEKSLFQIVSDSLEEVKPSGQGSKEVTAFKTAQMYLNALDESSARAKQLSLRGNKQEACRRMGNPFAK